MSTTHINVHTHGEPVSADVNGSNNVKWIEFKTGDSNVTIFVSDYWELVALADSIIQQVAERVKIDIPSLKMEVS